MERGFNTEVYWLKCTKKTFWILKKTKCTHRQLADAYKINEGSFGEVYAVLSKDASEYRILKVVSLVLTDEGCCDIYFPRSYRLMETSKLMGLSNFLLQRYSIFSEHWTYTLHLWDFTRTSCFKDVVNTTHGKTESNKVLHFATQRLYRTRWARLLSKVSVRILPTKSLVLQIVWTSDKA